MNPLRSLVSRAKRVLSIPLPPLRADELAVAWVTDVQFDTVARTFGGASPDQLITELRAQDPSIIQIAAAFLAQQPVAIGYMHWQGHRTPSVRTKHPNQPEIHRVHVLHRQRSRGIGAAFLVFLNNKPRRAATLTFA